MSTAGPQILQPLEKGTTSDLDDDWFKASLSYSAYAAKTMNLPANTLLGLASNTADVSSLAAKNTSFMSKLEEQGLSLLADHAVDAATEMMLEEAGITLIEGVILLNPEILTIIAAGAILKYAGNTLVKAATETDQKAPGVAAEAQQETDAPPQIPDDEEGESASLLRTDAEQE